MREAIKSLRVRGAPAIGVTAALGLYTHMKRFSQTTPEEFERELNKAKEYLGSSRPTAVNLIWALNRMAASFVDNRDKSVSEIIKILRMTALGIYNEDIETSRKIGEFGMELIKPGYGILTHCNAGALAAVKYGTALAPVYHAHERNINLRVYADETRPLLQGARLTAFELQSAGVDVTLICDNMAAYVMSKGLINAVFTGCDRVAANGDAANKIGTLGVAVLAYNFNVPFYICAPFSTIDPSTPADCNSKAVSLAP
jgi:methylthioribose-1-phosphate isomerase